MKNIENCNSEVQAKGRVHIVKTNADGVVTYDYVVPNLVVTTGKNFIAAKLRAITNSPTSMTHMGIGTTSTTPSAGDTALLSQTGRVSLSGDTATNNYVTFTATFPAGTGDGAIVEAGIFNAASGGTMLARTTFPVVTKGSGDTLAITWVVTVA
jgi:hypothetical protein